MVVFVVTGGSDYTHGVSLRKDLDDIIWTDTGQIIWPAGQD